MNEQRNLSKTNANEKNIENLYHEFNYTKSKAQEKLNFTQIDALKNVFKIQKADFVGIETKKKTLGIADLPFMGQISLENRKPRRGRKPKKSDICQLIFKNYGIKYEETVIKNSDEPLNLCIKKCTKDSRIEKIEQNKLLKIIAGANEMNKRKKPAKILISEPSSSEVNICKFKFVNGFLRERSFSSDPKCGSRVKCDLREKEFTKKKQINEMEWSIKNEKASKIASNCKSYPIVYDTFVKDHKNPLNQQEKSFEGRSFLIKTQEHLTANESVYYKFRHLKKFTRYLLKNWKDYLPKNIENKKK